MTSKDDTKDIVTKKQNALDHLSKANLERSGMDMTGFRIGKQRLVSKKKKHTPLKKLILAEREEQKAKTGDGEDASGKQDEEANKDAPEEPDSKDDEGVQKDEEDTSKADKQEEEDAEAKEEDEEKPEEKVSAPVIVDGLCLDAPEFIPSAWATTLEAQAATAKPGAEKGQLGDGNESAAAGDDRPVAPAPCDVPAHPLKILGAMSASTLEFVPSWHKDAEQTPAQWLDEEAPVADALERLRAPPPSQNVSEGKKKKRNKKKKDKEEGEDGEQAEKPPPQPQPKKEKKQPSASNIEVRHYVHQNLSEDLDTKVKEMLGELVRFQERAREKDPLKFAKLKRFCIGLREVTRAVQRGKAKCLVCAPNLEVCESEGGLDDTVEDLVELCRDNDVPVIFALSRNRLGKALGKNIRLSIIAVLSAEGAHQQFKECIKLTEELRRQWVLQQMMSIGGPPPIEHGGSESANVDGDDPQTEEDRLKEWAEKYSAPPKVVEEKKLTRQEVYDLKRAEELSD